MKLYLISIFPLLLLVGSVIRESESNQTPPTCRARSDLVGKCFSVHGRLSVYNGTPSIRLWPIGTKRLLGVIDPNEASSTPGEPILPGNIKRKLDWDKDVLGDFEVCPLTKQKPGHMQTVCIQSGNHLIVRKHAQ